MRHIQFFIVMFIAFGASPTFAEDVVKVWNNEPLSLHLKTGRQTRVNFPTRVYIQAPLGITGSLISEAPNRQMVFWTAKEDFEKGTVIATSEDGRDVYLIDVFASSQGLASDIVIEDPRRTLEKMAAEPEAIAPEIDDPAEVILTRFVAQTLYAPQRLVPADPNIQQLETPELPSDFPLLQPQLGESYAIEIIGQWMGYGHYLTAVLVKNTSDIPVKTSGAFVRGNFTNITPHHRYLSARGDLEDRTAFYLISDRPFQDAVMEDGYAW